MDNQPQNNNQMPGTPPVNSSPQAPNMPTSTINTMPNQPVYPQPGQPQAMPVQPVIPKKPMNPATKKTIIIVSAVVGALVILGIIAAIVLPIIFKIDYSETYRSSKELKEKVSELRYNSDCEYVVKNVARSYGDHSNYSERAESCRNLITQSKKEVDKLEKTAGVKRNKEIGQAFSEFKSAFDKITTKEEDFGKKLDAYVAWHKWSTARYKLDSKASDSDIEEAAKPLRELGNEEINKYAESWIKLAKASSAAYRKWFDTSILDKNYSAVIESRNSTRKALNDFLEKTPNIKKIMPIEFPDTAKMYTHYNNLHDLIRKTYQKNYNPDSKDCLSILGEVTCD